MRSSRLSAPARTDLPANGSPHIAIRAGTTAAYASVSPFAGYGGSAGSASRQARGKRRTYGSRPYLAGQVIAGTSGASTVSASDYPIRISGSSAFWQ